MGDRIAILNAGMLQQVGTPLEVYEKPANLFVAGFIGTPPMNFVQRTLTEGGALRPDQRLRRRRARRRAQGRGGRGRQGGRSASGRRTWSPPGRDAARRDHRLALTADLVELLGDEVVVHGRAGEETWCFKMDPHRPPAVGGTVEVQLELERLHLFDAETEQPARRLRSSGRREGAPRDAEARHPARAVLGGRCPGVAAAAGQAGGLALLPRRGEGGLREGGRRVTTPAPTPRCKVTTLAVPFDAFADKISAAVPRGKGPDIFIYAQDRLGGWIEAGNTVEPIDFFVDDALKGRFIPTTMEAMTYRGQRVRPAAQLQGHHAHLQQEAASRRRPRTTAELVKVAQGAHQQGGGALRPRLGLQRLLLRTRRCINGFGGRRLRQGDASPR